MATDPALILIVDDEPYNVDVLEQELGAAGYLTLAAGDGARAVAIARDRLPDLILLDMSMPVMDGFEACRRLKTDERTRAIPLIFLTAVHDTHAKVRAFQAGAVDYVTKPFEPDELLARVRTHIALRLEIEANRRSTATIRALLDDDRAPAEGMVGASAALQRVKDAIAQVAPTDSTVLILGETGTGKELVARAIHDASRRREGALIKLNCSALPRELVESELFGHEKGAFTGAIAQRRGRFELADGGTLFLDEVGELTSEAQAKLLRVLQERSFERLGGDRTLTVDVRVVAATNRDLRAEVEAGRFRGDLYYRLDVFPIALPPLRERREDVAPLIRHFAAKLARRVGRPVVEPTPAFVARATAYDWPGNVRELENVVERALITMRGDMLDGGELIPLVAMAAGPARSPAPGGIELEAVEAAHIRRVLEASGWKVEGTSGAAHTLGMNPSTLRGRMRKLGIRRSP